MPRLGTFGSSSAKRFGLTAGSGPAILSFIFSSDAANQTVDVSTLPGYKAGKTTVTITVNSGVYVYSTSISTPGLTISGATTGDSVSLINDGYIIGQGGGGRNRTENGSAENGGPALKLICDVSITNNSYIAGGGGGGGANYSPGNAYAGGGGGAGGGEGGRAAVWDAYARNWYGSGSGGGGGGLGLSGGNGGAMYGGKGAGGGGRILPGTGGGYGTGGGAGGGGGGFDFGGTGGSAGNAGGSASQYGSTSGGGGGWGASGGASGGSGGKAVDLNGYTATWVANGTRYGAIS
jgi:hypothetical protein